MPIVAPLPVTPKLAVESRANSEPVTETSDSIMNIMGDYFVNT